MTTTTLDALETLKTGIRGEIILPNDAGYGEARSIWNAMIDKHPAAIVRCTDVDDVVAAVKFAREHHVETAVRGGGHNIAGSALCDNGLVIDLSPMKTVRVDPSARRAFVGPGATLGDVDRETQAHGLAVPTGINSTTGISGLTLGGGFGWLTRRLGMTVDNLLSAEVVTGDGRKLHASTKENADLFWALRGGGGNFGIVTSFEFQLHPVGPEILAGLVVFPLSEAKQVLKKHREFMASAAPELNVWTVLRKAPPLPFLPAEVHGREVIVLAIFHSGDPGKGRKLIEPIRSFAKSYGEHIGVQPFTAWQQAFDPLLAPGARNYWKSHNFTDLEDGVLDTVIDYAGKLPSPHCEIFIGTLGGAAARVAADAMAYGNRDANFVMNVHSRWETPAEDAACIAWARDFFKASAPYATGGVYVNFMTADETDRIAAAYGPNYERLEKIKAKYDPDNFFHTNQNIRPKS
ncbi:MAG TPA: FAD-binding oxidoreductase [Opitutaceae bacterium]